MGLCELLPSRPEDIGGYQRDYDTVPVVGIIEPLMHERYDNGEIEKNRHES